MSIVFKTSFSQPYPDSGSFGRVYDLFQQVLRFCTRYYTPVPRYNDAKVRSFDPSDPKECLGCPYHTTLWWDTPDVYPVPFRSIEF